MDAGQWSRLCSVTVLHCPVALLGSRTLGEGAQGEKAAGGVSGDSAALARQVQMEQSGRHQRPGERGE